MASLKKPDRVENRLKRKGAAGNLNLKSPFIPMALWSEMELSDLMKLLKISNS
jgi:hypothetical protein